MDWVKLRTGYYLDAAIEEVGEAAEVLFVRALAWCGHQENGGFVPKKILPRLTPTRGVARARALVEHGLWSPVDGGWQITSWERHQVSRDKLDGKRESGRRRQATHRARHAKGTRNAVSDGVSNGVRDAEVTPREVEEEVEEEAAAAAGHGDDHPTDAPSLPTNVLILRQALEAHRLHVDWSRLSPAQVDEIGELVDRHGESPLIRSALAQYQPAKPAATAQAWLPAWRDLRAPGDLALVKPDPCPLPGHQGSVTRCAQCASEQKAAR